MNQARLNRAITERMKDWGATFSREHALPVFALGLVPAGADDDGIWLDGTDMKIMMGDETTPEEIEMIIENLLSVIRKRRYVVHPVA